MLVVIFDNPAPQDPKRKGVDVEIRIKLNGMDDDEGERLGEALHQLALTLRPGRKPHSFIVEPELLVGH